MNHLRARYYVGYLSAAAHYGASHQAPQIYQVVTDHRLAQRNIGRLRLRYYQTDNMDVRIIRRVDGPHGRWMVATPETCLLDCVERPDRAGGLGNVITIAHDLRPVVNMDRLAQQASQRTTAVVRRTGWLLGHAHNYPDLGPLRELANRSSICCHQLTTGPARTVVASLVDR